MDRTRTPGDPVHERTPHLAVLALAAVSLLGASAAPASAAADRFSCRASAIRVTGLTGVGLPEAEPVVANAAEDPSFKTCTRPGRGGSTGRGHDFPHYFLRSGDPTPHSGV